MFLIYDPPKISTYLSDHASIVFQLTSSNHKPKDLPKSYRSLNKIDVTRFKQDLYNSDIVTKPKTELNELVNQYNSRLSQHLDNHAPLRVKKLAIGTLILDTMKTFVQLSKHSNKQKGNGEKTTWMKVIE